MGRVVERGIPAFARSGLYPQVPAWALHLVYADRTVRRAQIVAQMERNAMGYAATPASLDWMSIPAIGAADTRPHRSPSIA